jgi:hypothetical protein
MAEVLLEAKAAALHPERYQSLQYLNYLQRGRVRRGKEAQAIGLATSQSDRQKSDGQTDRSKQGR